MIPAHHGRQVATMLVLSRKVSEQILIGDGIVITVVAIRAGQVRLGIEAPRQMPICRKQPRPAGEELRSDFGASNQVAEPEKPR